MFSLRDLNLPNVGKWNSDKYRKRMRAQAYRALFSEMQDDRISDEEVIASILDTPGHFGGAFVNVISDNLTQSLPPKPSPAATINIGDLVYWDTANSYYHSVVDLTTAGSEIIDQAQVRAVFLGISLDQILTTETAPPNRLVLIDGVCELPCPSQTLPFGSLIGSTWKGGSATVANAVTAAGGAGNSAGQPGLAIGTSVVYYSAATTVARFRMQSRWSSDIETSHAVLGAMQLAGSKSLADAAYQVLVSDPPMLYMTPTAGRTVTLPAVASYLNGFCYTIINLAAATSITLAAGGNLVGNATVAGTKNAEVCCDGTKWYSVVSA